MCPEGVGPSFSPWVFCLYFFQDGGTKELFDARWKYGHSPLHSAAYLVDPEFMDHKQWKDPGIMQDFVTVVAKIGVLKEVRERAERGELQLNRGAVYPTVADVAGWEKEVMKEHSLYRSRQGIFARESAAQSAKELAPHQWWAQYGSTAPSMQEVAMKVLAHPPSATSVERVNSEFSYVHDKKRNRLSHERAGKLVFVHHNLRVVRKLRSPGFFDPNLTFNDSEEESEEEQ